MRAALPLAVALALVFAVANPARAEVQYFFLHHSDTPVPVPGGTSSFFFDAESADTESPRLVEQNVLANGETATFPTFTSTPFAADTALLPIASVRLYLGANQKMRSCGTVTADLFKVDAAGILTPNGGAVRTDVEIGQGSVQGAEETTRIEFAVTDRSVLAGHGLALASSLSNGCSIQRRTFFEAGGAVRFQCCFTAAAKCGAKKIDAASKATECRLSNVAKGVQHAQPVDQARDVVCDAKTTSRFAKYELKGGCPTNGDAPDIVALLTTFAGGLDADLNPLGPNRQNKCQRAKIKSASTRSTCLLKLQAKAAARGLLLSPDPAKVEDCAAKFAKAFATAEAKGAIKGGCDTTGDAAAIAAKIDVFVTTVSSRLACPCE